MTLFVNLRTNKAVDKASIPRSEIAKTPMVLFIALLKQNKVISIILPTCIVPWNYKTFPAQLQTFNGTNNLTNFYLTCLFKYFPI